MKRCYILFLFFTVFISYSLTSYSQSNNKKTYSIKGKILAASDRSVISFAAIQIEELNMTGVADIDGNFIFHRIPEGEYLLRISSLSYSPKEFRIEVTKNQELTIKLDETSIALPEFKVMAKKQKGNNIVIGESAIEYIQPTSLADVMLLLPGSLYKENDMSSFGKISARQAGSDENTSLGVGIVADGAPITNDGNRVQMVGITENSTTSSGDTEIRTRTGINQGVDMRYLSTDHIQSVEFTKGISSAQHGNLSSGLIQVQSKYGVTPLRVRVKADLKNKLAYVGKGFKLSDKAGTLHLGVDYLNSIDDIREEMDKFTRLTAQAYYNNKLKVGSSLLGLDIKLNQTVSVQKMKKDELTYEYDEEYKADYNKTTLLAKGDWALNYSWLEKLEMTFSSDVTFDKISRHKMVLSSSGPLNVPLAKEEGEHEGIFLPSKYYSDFYIDNIPVNIFAKLNAVSRFSFTESLYSNMTYGLEYKNTKNHGEGAVIEDETRPPFPYNNSYMRPRPNSAIPALSVGAAYIQAEFLYTNQKHSFKLSSGLRVTEMFNLPGDYALSGKVLLEPRINMFYTFNLDNLKNTFRLGYGEENKLPTLDYLYPEKIYKDFYMLNAYSNQPAYRRLITHTSIFDVSNKDIRENNNLKRELGWDIEYKGFDLSLTVFYEKSNSGFEYFKSYTPLTYNLYRTPKPGVDIGNKIPQKEDYAEELYSVFTTYSRVMNSKMIAKKGIEYKLKFPQIKPLMTDVEINGAYYKTNYGTNLPEYKYPDVMIANQVYPYVGIYNTYAQNEHRQFNTNIWLNTHIPKYKLIFTNFVQFVWNSSTQYKDMKEKYPYAYIDFAGNINPLTAEDKSKIDSGDPVFQHFKKQILPINYALNSKPVSMLWNIKAMKEFTRAIRMSFFVNGILDISPRYVSGAQKTSREWKNPYFGFELLMNFNL